MKNHFLIMLLVSFFGFSQVSKPLESVNDYKYVIVPSKFSFLNDKDQFQLNTHAKMFMEKYGFVAYFDSDILPDAIANDQCHKLFLDVVESNSIFLRKLTVVLKDCRNNILYTSQTGQSKEKDLKVSYQQALRQAFNSFNALQYVYNGKSDQKAITAKKETVVLKENFDQVTNVTPVKTTSEAAVELNAQAIANGFQLVDHTPKIVLKIQKTSNPDIYIATNDTQKGVLIKYNGQWFFEYYENNQLVSTPMAIKF